MRELTYLEAIKEGIQQIMEKDEDVFLIGEDYNSLEKQDHF